MSVSVGEMAQVLTRDPAPFRRRTLAPADGEILERVAIALNSTLELGEVLKRLARISFEATSAGRASVFLLEDQKLEPAVCIGTFEDERLWEAFRSMGGVPLDRIPSGWKYFSAGRAIAIEDARFSDLLPREWVERFCLRGVALIPLHVAGEPCGLMALDYPDARRFNNGELRLLEAIGSYAGVAIRNARLFDDAETQLRRLKILHDLDRSLGSGLGAESVVKRLNELLTQHRIEVITLSFKDRAISRQLKTPEVDKDEWRLLREAGGPVALDDGVFGVPMRLGRRVIGVIRVRGSRIDSDDRSFLETLAHGVAEAVNRSVSRTKMEEVRRERAVAAERGRLAADLHDTAGQIFVAIGLLARREVEQLPLDSPLRTKLDRFAELAGRGKWEISQAIRALSFFPAARRGLVASLRAVAATFEEDSGIPVLVDVQGVPTRLSLHAERAFYRIAHEAITNSWRHGRCSSIRVNLSFGQTEIALSIVDDGIGFNFNRVHQVGIANMRRAMDEIEGHLRIRNIKPHGVHVEARILGEMA